MKDNLENQKGINLSRTVSAIEKLDNSDNILKAIAPTINWDEECHRYIKSTRGDQKYQDKTRSMLYHDLSQSSLISLIAPPMFRAEYNGNIEIPYYFCMSQNKFDFLQAYLRAFSSFLIEKKDIDGLEDLKFENYSKSQFLQSALTAFKETYKKSNFYPVRAFDANNISSINAWFDNVCETLKTLEEVNPVFNLKADGEKVNTKNLGSELAKESEARLNTPKFINSRNSELKEREKLVKIKKTLNELWLISLYLAKPKDIAVSCKSIDKALIIKENIDFQTGILPILRIAAKNIETDNSFSSNPINMKIINGSLFDYIASHQELGSFKELIDDLTSDPKIKSETGPILEYIAQDIFSRFAHSSNSLFMGRRGMSYGSLELLEEELKSDMDYFSNIFEKLKLLSTIEPCQKAMREQIEKTDSDGRANLLQNVLKSLAEQAPLALIQLQEIKPNHIFDLGHIKCTISQCAFLYEFIHEVILQANLTNKSEKKENVFIDYRNTEDIKDKLIMANKGRGSQHEPYFSLEEGYNVRREQHLQISAGAQYVPDFSALKPLIATLSLEEKESVIAYVRNNTTQSFALPGFKELNFIVSDINTLKITIEKMALDFKIQTSNQVIDKKTVLKV